MDEDLIECPRRPDACPKFRARAEAYAHLREMHPIDQPPKRDEPQPDFEITVTGSGFSGRPWEEVVIEGAPLDLPPGRHIHIFLLRASTPCSVV